MNLFKSKITSILSSVVLTLTLGTFASAQELNLPGFSGTLNTTVTSGVSMRVERDCERQLPVRSMCCSYQEQK